MKTFDIAWERTGLSSAYFLGSWTKAFVLVLESPLCGFSMFDQVRCYGRSHDVPKGQLGNIVGFSRSLVDVKLQQGIFKCSPEELELLNLKKGDGAKAHCPPEQKATPLDGACNRSAGVKSQRGLEPAAATKAASPAPTSSRAYDRTGPRSVQTASPAVGAPLQETPLDSTLYHGWVTWSRGSMAWLSCEALAATYPGCDVFLHRNDCNVMPKLYDRVSFQLTLDHRGNPKGIQATVETQKARKTDPEVISYTEYKQRVTKKV